MTDIAEIIERLERATGPDRELDAEILRATSPELSDAMVTDTGWCVGGNHAAPSRSMAYTSSIDAALTLVPEGWGITGISNCILDPKYGDIRTTGWQAGCAKIGDHYVCSEDFLRAPIGRSSTPAIAICIAALKARSRSDAKGK